MANPIEIRKLFLREVTRSLIFAAHPELRIRAKLPEAHEAAKQIAMAIKKTEAKKVTPAKLIQAAKPAPLIRQMQPPVAKPLAKPVPMRVMQPPKLPPLQKEQFAKMPTQVQTIESFKKINFLVKNPTIQAIECFGAGKPLSIRKYGMNQTINLSLTADEINSILKELSEKTKIPIVTGIFKVAFQNLLITASISEFVGTRFIIQKREALAPPIS